MRRIINNLKTKGRGTESRHAPPPTSTGREKDTDLYVDDSGSKIQKVSHRSSDCGECRFFQYIVQREHTQQQEGKTASGTGTQGIHQSLNSTIKKPWI